MIIEKKEFVRKQGCFYEPEDERYQVRRITIIGAAINVFLACIKFIFGVLGHSQAVIADAVHSMSDLSTDMALIFGVRYWSRPADSDHPYGHRRIEAITTTGLGIFLIAIAVGIGYNALISMRMHHDQPPGWIALWGALISIVFKEMLYHWTIKVGRRLHSSSVIANAWHHRTDSLSSIPVALAVIISAVKPAWAFLDHVGAVLVSILIIKVGWNILGPALNELADRGATRAEKARIITIATSVEQVLEVHAVRTRRMGPGMLVDMHLVIDPMLTVLEGHEIAHRVKKLLIEKGPDILDVTIHMEPSFNDSLPAADSSPV